MEKERLQQDVQTLREWYRKQPHLPSAIDDDYFLSFAKGCKTLETAKKKMDAFFSQRNVHVWFRDFDRLFERLKSDQGGDYFFLPGTTPEGWRVMMASYERVDVNKLDYEVEFFRRLVTLELGLHLWPSDTDIFLIFDMKNAGAKYFTSMEFGAEISACKYLQGAVPMRFKGALLLHSSTILEKTMNMMKPFLSKKIVDRLHYYSDATKMTEVFPLAMVPNDYGGEAGSIEDLGGRWKRTLVAHEEWLRRNSRLGSDERLRPRDCDLGCGTFRALAID